MYWVIIYESLFKEFLGCIFYIFLEKNFNNINLFDNWFLFMNEKYEIKVK